LEDLRQCVVHAVMSAEGTGDFEVVPGSALGRQVAGVDLWAQGYRDLHVAQLGGGRYPADRHIRRSTAVQTWLASVPRRRAAWSASVRKV
jgi:hypothetical protein